MGASRSEDQLQPLESPGADEARSVVGLVGHSIRLSCDLPVSDPPSVEWVDFVYNTDRDPQPIYSTQTGLDSTHVNTVNLAISTADLSLTISDLKLDRDAGQYICRSQQDGRTYSRAYYLSVGGTSFSTPNHTWTTLIESNQYMRHVMRCCKK